MFRSYCINRAIRLSSLTQHPLESVHVITLPQGVLSWNQQYLGVFFEQRHQILHRIGSNNPNQIGTKLRAQSYSQPLHGLNLVD